MDGQNQNKPERVEGEPPLQKRLRQGVEPYVHPAVCNISRESLMGPYPRDIRYERWDHPLFMIPGGQAVFQPRGVYSQRAQYYLGLNTPPHYRGNMSYGPVPAYRRPPTAFPGPQQQHQAHPRANQFMSPIVQFPQPMPTATGLGGMGFNQTSAEPQPQYNSMSITTTTTTYAVSSSADGQNGNGLTTSQEQHGNYQPRLGWGLMDPPGHHHSVALGGPALPSVFPGANVGGGQTRETPRHKRPLPPLEDATEEVSSDNRYFVSPKRRLTQTNEDMDLA